MRREEDKETRKEKKGSKEDEKSRGSKKGLEKNQDGMMKGE